MLGALKSIRLIALALAGCSVISALPLGSTSDDIEDLRAAFAELQAKLSAENADLRQQLKGEIEARQRLNAELDEVTGHLRQEIDHLRQSAQFKGSPSTIVKTSTYATDDCATPAECYQEAIRKLQEAEDAIKDKADKGEVRALNDTITRNAAQAKTAIAKNTASIANNVKVQAQNSANIKLNGGHINQLTARLKSPAVFCQCTNQVNTLHNGGPTGSATHPAAPGWVAGGIVPDWVLSQRICPSGSTMVADYQSMEASEVRSGSVADGDDHHAVLRSYHGKTKQWWSTGGFFFTCCKLCTAAA